MDGKKQERIFTKTWFGYVIYTLLYIAAVAASAGGVYSAAGICLISAAFYLYGIFAYKEQSLVSLKALFSLSWVGGEGVACLKLSKLSGDWEWVTWLCFYLAYLCFCIAYDFCGSRRKAEEKEKKSEEITEKAIKKDGRTAKRIQICIGGLALCSILCFCLEAAVVGYIPILSSKPHAYSYFHVSGVHYFTVSCILIPGLSLLYGKVAERISRKAKSVLIFGNLTAFVIPIICVSRFQLLFAVGFAAVIYLLLYRKISWKMVVAGVAVLLPMYVILTAFRHHDVAYLNGIFEMKNSKIPIFVTQPYIYVANNFENFNCMVRDLTAHTHGIRMLFPVWALSGLKFLFPQLTAAPVYITKAELTTLTVFYDAYYDFGVAGIIVFALLLGTIAGWMNRKRQGTQNPLFFMFYGQMAIYLGLSFFTTWFSNPTTWFWFALTFVMYLFVGYKKGGKHSDGQKKD